MAPIAPFTRALYPPSDPRKSEGGPDVVAVKRGISRAGFFPWGKFTDVYDMATSAAVAEFQKTVGIQPTGFYGKPTHTALLATPAKDNPGLAVDARAAFLFRKAYAKANDPALAKAEALLAFCGLFDGPYVYGGEHDVSIADDNVHSGFDCSSSTSFALFHVGLYPDSVAHVSGWFESYGLAGRGKYVTIHAAADHVWVEFTIPGQQWARFDTSPWGDGENGPRVRHLHRDDSRFVHRHPAGF